MNWVDVVLLVLVALSAANGLRQGAVVQLLSYGGFWVGLFLGALLTPYIAGVTHSHVARSVIAITMVLGGASLLGAGGRILGTRGSAVLRRLRLGRLDAAAGVAVAVSATLFAVWLVASLVGNSRFTGIDESVQSSRIVRALDDVLPQPPDVFVRIETYLSAQGFPLVFGGLPPVTASFVPLPSDSVVNQAVDSAGRSTVQIAGQACGDIQEGTGFVVAPGLVVTNAHVVAGVTSPTVLDGVGRHDAQVALFDPDLDIAVLRVPGLDDPPLRLDPHTVGRGAVGAVMGYPGGGPFSYGPAGVMELLPPVSGPDIYGNGDTTRLIYEIRADVEPGNSGSPLVQADGEVVGVVFARSTVNSQVGYALASPKVLSRVEQAQSSSGVVGTGDCVG